MTTLHCDTLRDFDTTVPPMPVAACVVSLSTSSCERASAEYASLDESRREIDASLMDDAGKARARAILSLVRGGAPGAVELVVATDEDDRGITMEFEANGRDLLFAIPRDGSRVYFAARGDGTRRAGLVHPGGAARTLGMWLLGGAFPTDGIVLG